MPTGLMRRGARYSLRRRVPIDLVEHFGREEVTRALGTADPKEARKLLPLRWAELDREFEQVRANLAASNDQPETPLSEISPTLISLINLDTLRAERDQAAREGHLKEFNDLRRNALRLMQAMLDGEIPASDDLRVIEGKRNALRALLTGENAFAISAARKARQAIKEEKAQGPSGPSLSLDELVDRWAAGKNPNARGEIAHRAVARWFVERCGDLPIEKITKADVRSFMDKLDAEGTSPANIKVKLSRLRTLLSFAANRDIIPTNPALGVRVEYKQRASDKRQAFSREQLRSLFSGPVHVQGARPTGGGGEAAYWLPLLSLYSGARQTELGQLHPDDVYVEVYEDGDGVEQSAWVMRFADNPDRNQRVKTEGSERRVPIHPDLIRLGFLQVAADARAEHRARIFHKINPTIEGELMGNWSKWFSRYRRSLGVSDRNTPFHSFRHSFKHHARESLIDKAVNDAITGHESGDVGDKYGSLNYPLRPLVEGMARYRVPGFKLPPPPASSK